MVKIQGGITFFFFCSHGRPFHFSESVVSFKTQSAKKIIINDKSETQAYVMGGGGRKRHYDWFVAIQWETKGMKGCQTCPGLGKQVPAARC